MHTDFQYSHSYVLVSMDAHSNTHLYFFCLVTQETDMFFRREESSGEIVKWALMGGHAISKKQSILFCIAARITYLTLAKK